MNDTIYIIMRNDGANPDSYPAFEYGFFTDQILAGKAAGMLNAAEPDASFYITSVRKSVLHQVAK